ncbi:uncharacterized protein DUF1905 [Arcticibacter tournemirensis]|uniref:DUF1905 domain-containing protein n=1 Tax=Arcticibacter tournemirensis TaxID=699437 RepID=A0A4Q0M7P4_9SPHI|nr:YdeI/OmpD-associated family protein [Arcticibacter tournemirensis]KAA8483113.1 YdeI/OmpD-associated family protein [Arcticibacter tournemirensis]RXF68819.1 DUF1905 domain-containing protein [Arcticibacter tournemirensis]TQM51974.1 uncharacterized protein DUF1905 [Arcticibacter tournemirensis]
MPQHPQSVTFTATLSPVEGPMIHHVIIVPQEVSATFRKEKGAVRVLCSVEGKEEFPCALNPRGEEYVIMASKQLIRKHRLNEGVPFSVSVRSDLNDGLELPEEFVEVLNQDEYASQCFEALLPGLKRSLLYYIRSAKSTDTRIKRSLQIAEKAKTRQLYSQKNKD